MLPLLVMPWHWQIAGKDGGRLQSLLLLLIFCMKSFHFLDAASCAVKV